MVAAMVAELVVMRDLSRGIVLDWLSVASLVVDWVSLWVDYMVAILAVLLVSL